MSRADSCVLEWLLNESVLWNCLLWCGPFCSLWILYLRLHLVVQMLNREEEKDRVTELYGTDQGWAGRHEYADHNLVGSTSSDPLLDFEVELGLGHDSLSLSKLHWVWASEKSPSLCVDGSDIAVRAAATQLVEAMAQDKVRCLITRSSKFSSLADLITSL